MVTATDSGETMCDCGKHVDGDEFALPAGGHVRAAHWHKSGSGEREVCGVWLEAPSVCVRKRPCPVHGESDFAMTAIPQDLAQRILAALESSQWDKDHALADELRAAVERKP